MILKAGDIRRIGDKVRRREYKGCRNYRTETYTGQGVHEYDWNPVSLVGHEILESDLIIAEFRRG